MSSHLLGFFNLAVRICKASCGLGFSISVIPAGRWGVKLKAMLVRARAASDVSPALLTVSSQSASGERPWIRGCVFEVVALMKYQPGEIAACIADVGEETAHERLTLEFTGGEFLKGFLLQADQFAAGSAGRIGQARRKAPGPHRGARCRRP